MPRAATKRLSIDRDDPEPGILDEAAAILRAGGLVAFATETVYGLGADATSPAAVARIFEAKGRPPTNPLIVHADGPEMARRCVAAWPGSADLLAGRHWPGPLTLVLPRSGLVPDIVTAGHPTVGVRVPGTGVATALIGALGRPIAAPSANRSTRLSPVTAPQVARDLDGRVDLILDSGQTTVGLESTILDLTATVPRVLRPGVITEEELRATLGALWPADPGPVEAEAPPSPGRMAVHYAPRTPTYRVDRERLETLPGSAEPWAAVTIGPAVEWRGEPAPVDECWLPTPGRAAEGLYQALHRCDELAEGPGGPRYIVIVPPPDGPEWRAVRDRVWRAARPWPGPPTGPETGR